MNCDLDSSVPDWLIEHPQAASVFAELRIGSECGGKSLEYVCIQRRLDPLAVLARLQAIVERGGHDPPPNT